MESHEQSSCYILGNWEKYRSRVTRRKKDKWGKYRERDGIFNEILLGL